MSDVSLEQKLRLVQQVRSRYHENQYDLSNRERLLYGRTGSRPERDYLYENSDQDLYGEAYGPAYSGGSFAGPSGTFSVHFRLRLLMALLLLAMVIIMDKNNINVAGITTEKIFEVISADYEEKIEEWMETMASDQ